MKTRRSAEEVISFISERESVCTDVTHVCVCLGARFWALRMSSGHCKNTKHKPGLASGNEGDMGKEGKEAAITQQRVEIQNFAARTATCQLPSLSSLHPVTVFSTTFLSSEYLRHGGTLCPARPPRKRRHEAPSSPSSKPSNTLRLSSYSTLQHTNGTHKKYVSNCGHDCMYGCMDVGRGG